MKRRLLKTGMGLIAAFMLVGARPPQRMTILQGESVGAVLHQCSRQTPAPGQGYFRPSLAQIAMLDHVAEMRSGQIDIAHSHAVEVIGIFRNGRRFVYGNYYPLIMQDGIKEAPTTPTVVCDGGKQFFGVEIDAATGRATHVAFNGTR